MPKVSVIIPVYNVKTYLSQCIESVINQTLKDIEIICIDDGSTDGSEVILDEYSSKDSRIKVIHKSNSGYGNTMNNGFAAAIGDYITIVESDDFAELNMLEKMYEYAVDTDADIVKSNYYGHINSKDYYRDFLCEYPKNKCININSCGILFNIACTIWSCIFKRSFIVSNNIRFNETPGASYQDTGFALQTWMYAEKVYFVNDAYLHYRNDNPNSSMHNTSKVFCIFDEYNWVEECFLGYWKKYKERYGYFIAAKYRDYLNHYRRIAPQFQYALLVRLSEELKLDYNNGYVKKEYFIPDVWQNIFEIHNNRDKFFNKTAKLQYDLKFRFMECGNDASYVEGFCNKLRRYDNIIVYGAGKIGKWLVERLKERNISINGFAVTDEPHEKKCLGYSVAKINSYGSVADNECVIIAVSEGMQFEIYSNLKNLGVKNIYRIDSMLRENL